MQLQVLAEVPAVLTAIRDFHRLKTRRERSEPLSPRDARLLVAVLDLLEPRCPSGEGRDRLMVASRRPVAVRTAHGSARGALVGLALRVVHVRVDAGLAPGQWVRIGIPRAPDGRWHRFRGRVLRVDGTSLASIALLAPAGVCPAGVDGA